MKPSKLIQDLRKLRVKPTVLFASAKGHLNYTKESLVVARTGMEYIARLDGAIRRRYRKLGVVRGVSGKTNRRRRLLHRRDMRAIHAYTRVD